MWGYESMFLDSFSDLSSDKMTFPFHSSSIVSFPQKQNAGSGLFQIRLEAWYGVELHDKQQPKATSRIMSMIVMIVQAVNWIRV